MSNEAFNVLRLEFLRALSAWEFDKATPEQTAQLKRLRVEYRRAEEARR